MDPFAMYNHVIVLWVVENGSRDSAVPNVLARLFNIFAECILTDNRGARK